MSVRDAVAECKVDVRVVQREQEVAAIALTDREVQQSAKEEVYADTDRGKKKGVAPLGGEISGGRQAHSARLPFTCARKPASAR